MPIESREPAFPLPDNVRWSDTTARGPAPEMQPAMFVLQRNEDPTGVSGTGIVAEGIRFSDGTVALRWVVGEHRSTVIWPNMAAVVAIHGHDGRTQIVNLI